MTLDLEKMNETSCIKHLFRSVQDTMSFEDSDFPSPVRL